MKQPPVVICFGEVLWDSLPQGLFIGGAPLNVAYHLQHQGAAPHLVSAVGRDWLGDELLRRLRRWGLKTDGIAQLTTSPTGTVRASGGPTDDIRYTVARDAAWDRIPADSAMLAAAGAARALVFGSLAQRSEHNHAALAQLLTALPADAERVFDVNLREPHDDIELVKALCRQASVIKLNAEEAGRLLGGEAPLPGREEAAARKIAAQTEAGTICITAGPRGAGLLQRGRWTWERGRPVAVADAVGAGDAFLASLLADLLQGGVSQSSLLARACRLGEWVASQHGATPEYKAAAPTRPPTQKKRQAVRKKRPSR